MAALKLPITSRVAVGHVVGCDPSKVTRRTDGRIAARGMPVRPDDRRQALMWQALIEFWGMQQDTLMMMLTGDEDFERFKSKVNQGRLNELIERAKNG